MKAWSELVASHSAFKGRALTILFFVAGSLWIGIGASSVVAEQPAIAATRTNVDDESQFEKSSSAVWKTFRGTWTSTGATQASLPEKLELLWTFKVEKGAFEASAAIERDRVFVADLDGEVFALDLKTGKKLWEYATESGFIASPTLYDKKVLIGDYDGRFYCLDADTGKALWVFETNLEIDAAASVYEGKILVGSQDATLYCLDAESGKVVWQHEIADQIRCTPTIADHRVFVAGCDGYLHIIDLRSGEETGKVEIGGPTGVPPAVAGTDLF